MIKNSNPTFFGLFWLVGLVNKLNMCRGTSFLEFRFLIFPIYIQKIILVVNGERGTGNGEWNEEWE